MRGLEKLEIRGRAWNSPQRLTKVTEIFGNQKKNRDYRDHSIAKIGLNTQKNSRDLRPLALTENPVKDYQLKLL